MKTEIRYGVFFALIVVVYVMIEHLLGFNTTRHDIGQYSRFAGILVPIIGVFFGIKAKREKDLNGIMTFRQGVKAGVIVAVVQTTITTLWFLLYGEIINPEFMDTMLEFERTKMLADGMTESAVTEQLAAMRTMFAPPNLQIFQELIGIAYGSLFAAIFSAFLKKKSAA